MPATIDSASALACQECGYDLRATAADGICPECGFAVAKSRRLAAIPRRPAWRDSDRRWRRRMLAGAWVLTLVPLMKFIQSTDWSWRVVMPSPFWRQGPVTLNQTYFTVVYDYLVFCIGVVLLFSKERGRRPARLDWSRRWGIVGSYGVLILGIPYYLFFAAMVLIGIAELFHSMPLHYQPPSWIYHLILNVGVGYIRYGIHPSRLSDAALPIFSALVVLLACVPLYNALRSTTSKVAIVLFLLPLMFGSFEQILNVAMYNLFWSGTYGRPPYSLFYFDPATFRDLVATFDRGHFSPLSLRFRFVVDAGKWLAIFAIALWLSGAQLLAIWTTREKEVSGD